MSDLGRNASRAALQKVEALLNGAKQNVADGNQDQSRQKLEDAYSTCEHIGLEFGERIKPLIDNARSHMDSGLTDKTIEIDIDHALAEVENIRPSL